MQKVIANLIKVIMTLFIYTNARLLQKQLNIFLKEKCLVAFLFFTPTR